MTELHALLERSVDHPVELDTVADVRRGRAALGRRRRLVAAGAAAGVLALGGATTAYLGASGPPTTISPADPGSVHAGSFEIPTPPEGWAVQAADESKVLIAPADQPTADFAAPNSSIQVAGKLLIHLQGSGLPIDSSTPVEQDGRTFYRYDGGGTGAQVGYRRSEGGWLILQEAPRLQWTTQQMVDYLDGVVVLPSAVPDAD